MSNLAASAPAAVYTFHGRLTLTGALHIGSGDGDDRTDATVVRDARGIPYIPGSSLRGALRAAVLRHAMLLFGLEMIRDEADLRDLEKQINGLPEAQKIDILTQSGNKLNAVERLFGTTMWASPLHIADMPLQNGDRAIGEIRHGVGIDRDTGAAADGLKYDFEVLPSGYQFTLQLRCEMEAAYERDWSRLLALGLRLLELSELPLGGRQARGVGQVRLDDLTVYRLDMRDRAGLLAALLGDTTSPARYGVQLPAGWTTRVLQEA